ncbi:MAG: cell surface protein, partial [Rhodopirellula sp. JB053]
MTFALDFMFRKLLLKAVFANGVASITPHRRTLSLILAILVVGISFTTVAANDNVAEIDVPSFRRDVMPVFFRAGCNAGSCHGAASGKDGFMLSLFGYDPKGDYHRTVNEMVGRRVNTAVPEQSLLLLKSTGKVAHTGGKL